MSNKVIIASDHGGYEAKCKILDYFKESDIEFIDVGCDSTEIVRYPHYAKKVVDTILSGEVSKGILLCSTGIGMSIIANKHKGIRAALCTSTYMAKMTRKHNDSNILCLGGRITGDFELFDIIETWLSTEFEGGRHCISLDLIKDEEEIVFN